MEQYARLTDYPNYAVSNFGNVLNIKTQRILNLSDNGLGYNIACLSKNGITKTFRVNRLVALYFIDNPNDYKCVDHIDRNRANNNINNLRWVSNSQNSRNIKKRGQIVKDKLCNSWQVRIKKKCQLYLKSFKSLAEAEKHLKEKILEVDCDIITLPQARC